MWAKSVDASSRQFHDLRNIISLALEVRFACPHGPHGAGQPQIPQLRARWYSGDADVMIWGYWWARFKGNWTVGQSSVRFELPKMTGGSIRHQDSSRL